jgi:hypothetical protein
MAYGRAVAQVVRSRVRVHIKLCGIYGKQRGNGAGFLRVFRFLLSIIYSTNYSTIITAYHPDLVQ